MPSSEYASAAGGALRLKGGAGVDKKKTKKKKKQKPNDDPSRTASMTADPTPAPTAVAQGPSHEKIPNKEAHSAPKRDSRSLSPDEVEREIREAGGKHKTEAEKRHEEARRKRLNDRLKREGVKTHKERVEELNRYLSGLSEHHDMPKIGPG
ncbi:hypothetical protein B0J11DRAFT_503828 [Dendryphion nanum]|uniref:DUF1754-domain-containing protein n=1 Tax=Dendryphion nanum TaxID=256645 RepID=A0A9P9E8B6_9PLEO|nr:hypothetical protein B0J11DRAFT_503828 [Dendryphion nanum]